MSTAIVLSCHGTVESADDIPAFLANIRRGRPVPAHLVEEVRRRFEAIGGSPLMRTTRAQGAALSERMGLPVATCGRLWAPYAAEAVGELAAAGVTRVVSLPLAPQSVHIYHPPVREAAAAAGMEVIEAPSWGDEPRLIDAFLESIDEALGRVPEERRAQATVLLTAHSLPQRVIDAGDPYERDFRAMAARVAERIAERGNPSRVAFQSQGATNDVWIGPDLPATLKALAEGGARDVVIAPIGFVADHVETLYDLDVEAKGIAEGLGLGFSRALAMNVRPAFIDALEAVARRAMSAAGRPTPG